MKLTREEAKEMLPIIQAWADGQTVDWYDPAIGWRLSGFTLDFDKKPNFYRIKPEPKYRPFKTREECWEEMHKHPDFGWVKVNGNVTCEYEQIIRIVDYRKTRDECWEEMHKHPDFGWVKVNATGEYEQIVRIFDYCKTELSFNIANSDDDYTSEMMLNSYTFTDGTPFGIKE